MVCGPSTKVGSMVRFVHPDAGYDGQVETARKSGLRVGNTYRVIGVNVCSWHTDLKLDGIGDWINSVMFEPV